MPALEVIEVKVRPRRDNPITPLTLTGQLEVGDRYARLTYQAWEGLETEPVDFAGLERLAGEARS